MHIEKRHVADLVFEAFGRIFDRTINLSLHILRGLFGGMYTAHRDLQMY